MHFFILLALLYVPGAGCQVPRATCDVPRAPFRGPGAAFQVPRATANVPRATRVVEETVESVALGRAMKYRVLLPQEYGTSQRRYPVLYLLHGLDGDYTDWTSRTNLADYSRALPLIIVMPDGANSWYVNAAGRAADRFEDYILTDLHADVVTKYRVVNSRYGRSIAGLSMGGYGAVKMALKRPGAFALAASFSGAFSATRQEEIRTQLSAASVKDLDVILGAGDSPTRRENDVYTLAGAAKPTTASFFYIDCGAGDRFLSANREVVAAISRSGLPYEYHELPGGHAWDYWDRRIRAFLPVLMKRVANP